MEKVYVEFPGLGIDQFVLNKVAFTLFNKIEVRWYGIFITLGIVLAFIYACWRGKRNEGIIPDDVMDVGILTVIMGVIGARLYYVLTKLESFPTFWSAFQIWNGGLGIYGGIIGGCLGIVIACKVKKISWLKLFDMAGPGVMIAQAIGRWGNFFNGEAYGYPITADGTRYFFFLKEFRPASGEGTFFNWIRMGLYPNEYAHGMIYVHPTFLYECVWNVLGFIVINLLYKKKKFDGQIALMYFAWYGFGRMFIEGFRTDSLYILDGVVSDTGLRISQCVGLLCFVVGLTLILVFTNRRVLEKLAARAEAKALAAGASPELTLREDVSTEELEDALEDEEALADVEAIYGEEAAADREFKYRSAEQQDAVDASDADETADANEENNENEYNGEDASSETEEYNDGTEN